MISKDKPYVVQLLSTTDGTRSAPFVSTIDRLLEIFCDMTESEKDTTSLLILADVIQDENSENVPRYPVYRISTWLTPGFPSTIDEVIV